MSDDGTAGAQRAHDAIVETGIEFTVTTHGPVHSLEEAAAARDELFRLRKCAFGVEEHDALQRKDAA